MSCNCKIKEQILSERTLQGRRDNSESSPPDTTSLRQRSWPPAPPAAAPILWHLLHGAQVPLERSAVDRDHQSRAHAALHGLAGSSSKVQTSARRSPAKSNTQRVHEWQRHVPPVRSVRQWRLVQYNGRVHTLSSGLVLLRARVLVPCWFWPNFGKRRGIQYRANN